MIEKELRMLLAEAAEAAKELPLAGPNEATRIARYQELLSMVDAVKLAINERIEAE